MLVAVTVGGVAHAATAVADVTTTMAESAQMAREQVAADVHGAVESADDDGELTKQVASASANGAAAAQDGPVTTRAAQVGAAAKAAAAGGLGKVDQVLLDQLGAAVSALAQPANRVARGAVADQVVVLIAQVNAAAAAADQARAAEAAAAAAAASAAARKAAVAQTAVGPSSVLPPGVGTPTTPKTPARGSTKTPAAPGDMRTVAVATLGSLPGSDGVSLDWAGGDFLTGSYAVVYWARPVIYMNEPALDAQPYRTAEVVRHEMGHIYEARAVAAAGLTKGQIAAQLTSVFGGTNSLENAADCVALHLGATWTAYTSDCAGPDKQTWINALTAGTRP